MSSRRLLICALTGCIAVQMSAPAAHAEAGGAIGGGGSEVSSWVVGQGPGGGVTAPSGTTCTPWDHAANISPEAGPPDVGTVRQDEAGVIWNLYYRNCEGTVQYVWVPMLTPADLGELAFDQVLKNLPKPLPALSPDLAVGGYVNFETWLSVADPGVIAATSSIPGLSATATARVVRIEWRPGDGSLVTCEPFGALPPTPDFMGPAPCGHTFTQPSHAKVTGSADDRYHGSVTLIWAASWVASNGASGDLGEAASTVPFIYRVREIQTIGAEG